MVSSIKNQQVVRRKKAPRRVKKAKKPDRKQGKVRTFKLSRKVSIYAAAGLCVILSGLFISSSVPIFGSVENAGGIALPADPEIESYLFEYLDDPAESPEREVELPHVSVLASIDPVTRTIAKGDTLSEISEEYGISLGTLISFNKIQDVRKIKIGTSLKIPNSNGVLYTVRKGDNLSSIADRHDVSLNDILDANDLETSVITSGQELFIPGAEISSFELKKATGQLFVYPVRGSLSSPFGMRNDPFTGVRRMHYGIDLANYTGTPVKASMEGTIITVGYSSRTYGNYIIMKHAGGFQTLYGHLHDVYVTNGMYVRQGQTIGTVGNTGRSTGPHLHFSIYKYQNPVDPLKYLF